MGKIKTGLTAWKAAAIGVCGNKAGFSCEKEACGISFLCYVKETCYSSFIVGDANDDREEKLTVI